MDPVEKLIAKWEAYVKGMEAGMPKLSEGSQEIASYQVLVAKRFIADLERIRPKKHELGGGLAAGKEIRHATPPPSAQHPSIEPADWTDGGTLSTPETK